MQLLSLTQIRLLTPCRHSFCENTSWLSLVEEVRKRPFPFFPLGSYVNFRCRKVGFDDSVHSESFRGRIRSYHRGCAHSHDAHVAAFQSFMQIRTANNVSLMMRLHSSTFSTPPVRRNTGEYFVLITSSNTFFRLHGFLESTLMGQGVLIIMRGAMSFCIANMPTILPIGQFPPVCMFY